MTLITQNQILKMTLKKQQKIISFQNQLRHKVKMMPTSQKEHQIKQMLNKQKIAVMITIKIKKHKNSILA